ncbi:MAG: DinB family protein [Bacteroidota bacterium]|nr:DinB family protein [Bacteroidota bacterium]
MQRTKWVDRIFTFDLPPGWIPDVLERLRGTVPRLNAITINLSDAVASFKPQNKWSIREHIGHLLDLEDLHSGRIDDFISRKEILRAADMSNAKTYQSNHNEKTCAELIEAFAQKRNHLISCFVNLDDETQLIKSLHPRLQVPVRPIDIAYFTAEHDDHHLADIREILELKC